MASLRRQAAKTSEELGRLLTSGQKRPKSNEARLILSSSRSNENRPPEAREIQARAIEKKPLRRFHLPGRGSERERLPYVADSRAARR